MRVTTPPYLINGFLSLFWFPQLCDSFKLDKHTSDSPSYKKMKYLAVLEVNKDIL